jgi:nitroreductase
MANLLPLDLLCRLQWRYAVKKFDASRKISPTCWESLETALQLTPSSYGLQPWKFFVVESAEVKEKLRTAAYNQSQVTDCSHFVVFTHTPEVLEADVDKFLNAMSETRSIPPASLDGYRRVILGDVHGHRKAFLSEWTRHQSYIALGNFMTSCALVGVDTCPMEGISPAKFDEILDLNPTRYRTVVACAAGYRSPDDAVATQPKIRYPKSDIIEHR